MAELQQVADQFAKDLAAQNIAGLMMAFTPNGMGQAMALQAQMAAAGPQPANAELIVEVTGTEGASSLVDLIFKGAEGSRTIATKWIDVAGAWKVDAISLKL
ncbi:MAG: hypothetical protein ABI939_10950 [Anaerolineaceae bacterium]